MASKKDSRPAWQKESQESSEDTTKSQPLTLDDPVYAQEEAASDQTKDAAAQQEDVVEPQNSISPNYSSSKTISEHITNDDPVYPQVEAASNTPTPETIALSNDDPVYSQSEAASQSQSSLLSSASKFLSHPSLFNASIAKKKEFLLEKGLTAEEIDSLLTSSDQDSAPAAAAAQQASPSPPIITYPEFLLHAHAPKPLITRSRIANAVYATGLLAGSVYLANKYLFEPMALSMAEARHDFFGTAIKGVEDLNEKLEAVVSSVPPAIRSRSEMNDGESEAEDPEELFHRDIGVQTTVEDDQHSSISEAGSKATAHTERVQSIQRHLKDLQESSDDVTDEDKSTLSTISDLKSYLEGLSHSSSRKGRSLMPWEAGYSTESKDRDKEDEIAKFKAEIRSVKGALLSARNFPARVPLGGLGSVGR